jgi:RsiW-degrading membrane proteinase PrsW (M82 family)
LDALQLAHRSRLERENSGETLREVPHEQIGGWRVSVYYKSRDPGLLVFMALLIVGIGVGIGYWISKSTSLEMEEATTLRSELAKPEPDPEAVLRLLMIGDSSDFAGVEEVRDLLKQSRLRGDQKSVALALMESLTTESTEPGAKLLKSAFYPAGPRFANEVIGDLFHYDMKFRNAVRFYRREMVRFGRPEVAEKLGLAAYESKDPALVQEVLDDKLIQQNLEPRHTVLLKSVVNDWKGVWVGMLQLEAESMQRIPLTLSILSAVVWGAILLQAGQIPGLFSVRCLMMIAALVLGIASTLPTLFFSLYHEQTLGLTLDGTMIGGLNFFVLGVGLREEALKLLFFLPLVPLVLTRGKRLEAVVVPAMVGLGFAVWENLQYFAEHDASVAFTRFLTANFFHLSLTGLVGYNFCRIFFEGFKGLMGFVLIFTAAVVGHGLYDTFLVVPQFASFASMSMLILALFGIFFLQAIAHNRDPITDQLSIATTFTVGLSTLVAAAFIFAAQTLGFVVAIASFVLSGITLMFLAVILYWKLGEGLVREV